jgi:hypothetical protein
VAIDFGSDVGMVRLLICDVDEAALVFTTPQVQAFLDLEGGNIKLAAAQALDVGATNEVFASKVIKDHQLSTDGAKAADAVRKHAAALRAQVVDGDDGFLEVIDFGGTTPELTEAPTRMFF